MIKFNHTNKQKWFLLLLLRVLNCLLMRPVVLQSRIAAQLKGLFEQCPLHVWISISLSLRLIHFPFRAKGALHLPK